MREIQNEALYQVPVHTFFRRGIHSPATGLLNISPAVSKLDGASWRSLAHADETLNTDLHCNC